jgi:CRISPR/Cas system-associated exonuclease Cas4 (RecB family)
MTRAIDRLIISGSIDPERTSDETTPIGWVLGRLDAKDEIERADGEPVELEREGARVILRVDRFVAESEEVAVEALAEDGQLALFDEGGVGALPALVPALQPLVEVPKPPAHRVRRLSFSALALFDRCSYRYYAERVVGMRPVDERRAGAFEGTAGLAATEVGDAVHRLLELVNLEEPLPPDDLAARVRGWYPRVSGEELERIDGFVRSYCESELARRVAALPNARPERPFAFEHDRVLLHGRLDVLQLEGESAVVVDYKTNSLAEGTPEEIVESDYRLQRLVYALACFRAGAHEVEVVYHFLERPDAVVSTVFRAEQIAELEAELSEAIARINGGEFRPTPSEYICAGCPALDVVCAGPRLRSASYAEHVLATVS